MILRCPLTGGDLRPVNSDVLKELRATIATHAMSHLDGMTVRDVFDGFLQVVGNNIYDPFVDIVVHPAA
jgi:hypothetical protein